ncbi:MAG: glycosyltransferase family 39 protein [Chthoniobacterales bacterium]|nr:glycosyltransferase family 39 protein [Chthoniobacterales bacterium]
MSFSPRRFALAAVAACGLLLGYFVVRAFVSPLPHQYQLDFGAARWIEPPETAPVAYFRKTIFLSATPEQAWLQIAAIDNFKLIVNGRSVASESLTKTRVAGIYDVKRALNPGLNVIGISIARISFPGSAQVLVRGLVREAGGKITDIISDTQWRVTPETGIVEGSEKWNSPLVEEQLWPNAQLARIDQPIHINWVDLNPLVLQLPPTGSWIMTPDAGRAGVFSGILDARRLHQETWIQVASSGDLDLLVNGNLITTREVLSSSSKRPAPIASDDITGLDVLSSDPRYWSNLVPRLKPTEENAASPAPTVLQVFDISSWIKKGRNDIVAIVRSARQPASFLANGFTLRQKNVPDSFATDSEWRVLEPQPGAATSRVENAVEASRNGEAPWGYLPQKPSRPIEGSDFNSVVKPAAAIALSLLAVAGMWLLFSTIIAAIRSEPLADALCRDALLHAPVLLGLLFLLVAGYDVRLPHDWPFQRQFVQIALVSLLVLRIVHFLPFVNVRRRVETSVAASSNRLVAALPYLALAAIMTLGLAVRYQGLDYISFDHDEMGVVSKSMGVPKLGFPYRMYAGAIKPATTYELVSYPLAIAGVILGYSEWSMRLPSCIFGTLSILLVALISRRLFDWRTGLASALVYACFPVNIRWAQNAFYLQQCQFFALLTIWLFYEAIRVRPFRRGFLTAATAAFCATYLSWEGTAFLLVALVVALLVFRRGEWWWLKDFHLLRCVFAIGVVVIVQYCSRTYFSSPYSTVGFGLSNLTGPSLFFLNSRYHPLFYVDRLLLSEGHVPFTLALLCGLPFCWHNRAFRYLVTILFSAILLHTNFLAALSPRYCYYYQPLLLIGGTAAAFMLIDRLISLARAGGDVLFTRPLAAASGFALLALLFLPSNELALRTYPLSASQGEATDLMARLNTYRYDYRSVAHYVKDHIQEGDVVIPGIPHVFEYYSGIRGDYFLNTMFHMKTPYNGDLTDPVFVDKFVGYPAIRNLAELKEVIHRGRRTWIIFAPYSSFQRYSTPDVLEYLDKSAKVVFETYRAKVLLIEGPPSPLTAASSGNPSP